MNKNLLYNIRFYVLISSFVLSGAVYVWITTTIPVTPLQTIRLEQIYGFISIFYIYLTLLSGPFSYTFSTFPLNTHFLKARRALGVSAFYFSLLHSFIAFFGQLNGFVGLTYLDNNLLFSLLLGFIALCICFILTITSTDYMVEKLSFPRWKLLHRLTYLAGIFILIHTVIIGTHYADVKNPIPQITFLFLAFLLLLESPRFDKALKITETFGISFVIVSILLTYIYMTLFQNTTNTPSIFNIHASHIQLAQQAQQTTNPALPSNIPGLDGDRTKRYTVSFNNPQNIQPNQPIDLTFTVYDANNGNPILWYRPIYSKLMHVIIVNDSLTYFQHIHPTETQNIFTLNTTFPNNGIYHIYTDFQPLGGIEQQMGFTLNVGNSPPQISSQKPDTNKVKTFGSYQIAVDTHGYLNAKEMSIGQQLITFTLKDTKTKKPITNLKPYLAAFGHVTMVNEQTYDFIHIHPSNLIPPPADASSGPSIEFLPLGIYGPLKPGIYRTFAEFNPGNKRVVADFTLEVK